MPIRECPQLLRARDESISRERATVSDMQRDISGVETRWGEHQFQPAAAPQWHDPGIHRIEQALIGKRECLPRQFIQDAESQTKGERECSVIILGGDVAVRKQDLMSRNAQCLRALFSRGTQIGRKAMADTIELGAITWNSSLGENSSVAGPTPGRRRPELRTLADKRHYSPPPTALLYGPPFPR
jgi:hypothetical protein